jgi:hypothetical protein
VTWNMPDGPVILNNTPLVALWSIGRLDLLRDLFGEVFIPQAVEAEFLAIDRSLRERSLADAPWVRAVILAQPRRALAFAKQVNKREFPTKQPSGAAAWPRLSFQHHHELPVRLVVIGRIPAPQTIYSNFRDRAIRFRLEVNLPEPVVGQVLI